MTAIVVTSAPDHWEGEDVIITIEEEGKDSVLNFEGTVLKINKSGGDEPKTEVPTFGGRYFTYGEPRKKISISMDIKIKNMDWDKIDKGGSGTLISGYTGEVTSIDARLRKRVIFWFIPKANQQRSGTIIVPPNSGPMMRRMFCDCESVTFDWEFDAGEYKKGTITLELTAADEDGYANEFSQYTPDQSTTTPLAVLSTTCTTHKGAIIWNSTTPAWTGSYRT